MKSCTVPAPYGVDSFPVNGPAITRSSSGSFHEMLPLARHWWITSRICVTSTQPATSTRPSAITCASVPSTGPVVITGEQILTRRFARWMSLAMRADRSSPWPGVNQARTPSSQRGSTNPLFITSDVDHSWSKSMRNAFAIASEWTIAITFSCRDHESSVQFSEPVQTSAPSRITNLWCIRSGTPAIGLAVDRQRGDQLCVGLRWRRHRDRESVIDVVGETRLDTTRRRHGETRRRRSPPSPDRG